MTERIVTYIIDITYLILERNCVQKGVYQLKDYAAGKPWKIRKQQHILKTAYSLFSEKGIIPVTMIEIAKASGVGRATVFRYFTTKLDLVIAVSIWKWEQYMHMYNASVTSEEMGDMTGAAHLRFFLDAFLELYRNHSDILRYNYDFNSFLRYEAGTEEQRQPYRHLADVLRGQFHNLYESGIRDGTLRDDVPESTMFSFTFHIMLAAVTRYAVGLVVVYEDGGNPESELEMLKDMLLSRFTKQKF